MRVSIVQIGNSKGIRLSKAILEQYGIGDFVNLVLKKGYIIIEPVDEPRNGWKEAFLKESGDTDQDMLIPEVFEDEEDLEWD